MTLPSQSAGHTPGPWYFGIAYEPERGPVSFDYQAPGYYENPGILGADGQTVVGCDEYNIFGPMNEATRQANIALIARAPDLLAENSKLKGQLEEAVGALEAALPLLLESGNAARNARALLDRLKEAGS